MGSKTVLKMMGFQKKAVLFGASKIGKKILNG